MNSLSFKELSSNSRIFYQLDQFYDSSVFALDGTHFKVHKLFLSKGSDYFQACFRTNFGNPDNYVNLDFESNILENILIFLYTGEVYLTEHNIADMIIAADYLLIDSLLEHCKYFVLQRISLECCASLLVAALVVERLGLFNHCYRFVQVHFGKLVQQHSSPIVDLPLEVLKSLLMDDNLGVLDEKMVLEAIVLWVHKNTHDREHKVQELLYCLRCSHLSILNQASGAVTENILLQNLVQNTSRLGMAFNRCPRKLHIFFRRKVYPYPTDIMEMFLTYDEQLDIWRKIGETNVSFHVLIPLNNLLFLFNTMTNRLKVFDLIEKKWLEKEGVQNSRQSYWAVKCNQRIYVVGGYFCMSNVQVSNIKYYEPKTDFWVSAAHVPPMTICGASVVNDEMYVVGYVEDTERLEMRAAAYKEPLDAWVDVSTPRVFRTQFGMLGFHQRVFIFGGRTEDNEATVASEFYDPESDAWGMFHDLPFPYELPQAVALQNKMMVYDDCPSSGHQIPRFSPCVWNAEAQMWEVVDVFSPFNEIHRYSFCSVNDRHAILEVTKENRDPRTEWLKTPFANV